MRLASPPPAAGVWLVADLVAGQHYAHEWIAVWNSATRFAVFMIVVRLLASPTWTIFKSINRHLGHAGGDDVLQLVGAALRGRVRSTDIVGRLGGNEFGVFFHVIVGESSQDAVPDYTPPRSDAPN